MRRSCCAAFARHAAPLTGQIATWVARLLLRSAEAGRCVLVALRDDARRIDQRDVRERLREVADKAACARVVLLREEAHVVAQADERARRASSLPRGDPGGNSCRPARTCTAGTPLRLPGARRRPNRSHNAARDRWRPRAVARSRAPSLRPAGRSRRESPPSGSSAGWRRASSIRRSPRTSPSASRNPDRRPRRGCDRAGRATARAGRPGPSVSRRRTARSNATHAITFECVNCLGGPRTSQMPWSGSYQHDSRYSRRTMRTSHAVGFGSIPSRWHW